MKARLGLFGVVLLLLALLVACAPAAAPTPTPTKAPAAPTTAPTAPPAAKPAEPAKPKELTIVRAGLAGTSSDAGLFLAAAKGYFEEQGIKFEHVPFRSPPDMAPALATDQVQVAGLGAHQPPFLNALFRGIPLKSVADKGSLLKGAGYIAFVVRKELVDKGRYKSPSDLKGLKVAITPPAMTSPNALNLDILLRQGGLTMKDVEVVDLALADMAAGLAGGSIDAAFMAEPSVGKAVEMGIGVRVLGGDEINPNQQLSMLTYSPAFMKDRPDVAKRFMVAYLKGVRDYNDAFFKNKGKADTIKILTVVTDIKEAAVWEKAVPPGLNPDGYINIDSVMATIDWQLARGAIEKKPKAEEIIDHQYADYAISVLGKYK